MNSNHLEDQKSMETHSFVYLALPPSSIEMGSTITPIVRVASQGEEPYTTVKGDLISTLENPPSSEGIDQVSIATKEKKVKVLRPKITEKRKKFMEKQFKQNFNKKKV